MKLFGHEISEGCREQIEKWFADSDSGISGTHDEMIAVRYLQKVAERTGAVNVRQAEFFDMMLTRKAMSCKEARKPEAMMFIASQLYAADSVKKKRNGMEMAMPE